MAGTSVVFEFGCKAEGGEIVPTENLKSTTYFRRTNRRDGSMSCWMPDDVAVAPSAYLSADAVIGSQCVIGHLAVIGNEVVLAERVTVLAKAEIFDKVRIGARSKIGVNNRVLAGAEIGEDVLTDANLRIPAGDKVADNTHYKVRPGSGSFDLFTGTSDGSDPFSDFMHKKKS